MRAGARLWIAVGVMLLVASALLWVRARGHDDDGERYPRPTSRGLDVAAFRSELAARLRRAKAVAARQSSAPAGPPAQGTGKWPMLGKGVVPSAGTFLIEPQCTLGPRELCKVLDGLVRACDAGAARDCLAVGQYLADTPPRAAIAVTFFLQACRIGDPAGCERVDELKSASKVDCERDPLACSYTAMRTQNRELHDLACSFGAADSCSFMSWFAEDDVELSRAYLEQACQLGLPMACAELGHRLQPGCVESDIRTCYAPDPREATAALEIGCAAGWVADEDCVRIERR